MGIDRLVMFLTNSTSKRLSLLSFTSSDLNVADIKEVLLFPAMKPLDTAINAAAATATGAPGPAGQI